MSDDIYTNIGEAIAFCGCLFIFLKAMTNTWNERKK